MKNLAIATLGLIAIFLSVWVSALDAKQLAAVKDGLQTLSCDIVGKGVISIDPEVIVDFVDGTWVFTNGSARACQVEAVE